MFSINKTQQKQLLSQITLGHLLNGIRTDVLQVKVDGFPILNLIFNSLYGSLFAKLSNIQKMIKNLTIGNMDCNSYMIFIQSQIIGAYGTKESAYMLSIKLQSVGLNVRSEYLCTVYCVTAAMLMRNHDVIKVLLNRSRLLSINTNMMKTFSTIINDVVTMNILLDYTLEQSKIKRRISRTIDMNVLETMLIHATSVKIKKECIKHKLFTLDVIVDLLLFLTNKSDGELVLFILMNSNYSSSKILDRLVEKKHDKVVLLLKSTVWNSVGYKVMMLKDCYTSPMDIMFHVTSVISVI